MEQKQTSLRHASFLAPIRRCRRLVRLLLPEGIRLHLDQWRLTRSGVLVMEPFSSLGQVQMVTVENYVSIGRRSYWNSGMCWDRVRIGRYCSIACNVSIGVGNHRLTLLSTSPFIYGVNFQEDHIDTVIANDVYIGENAIVMKGVRVGDGAVIGAGAIVTHDVPPWAIVVGVPARVLKYRFDERTRQRLAAVQWWTMDEDELRRLDASDVESCLSALESFRSATGPHSEADH